MKLKSLESDLGLILAAATNAVKVAKRAADDSIDTAAAYRLAYPVPDTIRERAVGAAVRVTRSNTCTALRVTKEVEEMVTALANKVTTLKGVTA